MVFTRWDPLRELLVLQERMDHLAGVGVQGWSPPVDVYETPDAYIVSAEVPGLARDDIDIRFHDGHLTINGTRRAPNVPCERYHRVERGHGAFARRFALPSQVDVDAIAADLCDGVLTITVPKAAGATPRRIRVG